jgi:hypothetical protein
MATNHKSIIMSRNRSGIIRAVVQRPCFGTAYGLLHQFLSFTTLSGRNTLWAAKHVQLLRENKEWIEDIDVQQKLAQLDGAVDAAKERLRRREEKRARIEAAAEPKVDRRRKVEPDPASSTPTDLLDIYQGGKS